MIRLMDIGNDSRLVFFLPSLQPVHQPLQIAPAFPEHLLPDFMNFGDKWIFHV